MFTTALVVLCTCWALASSSTTLQPEREESGSISFYYDPESHFLVAATSMTCFMAKLTRDESDHVHITGGLNDIELRMMREWVGTLNESKVYHDDPNLPTTIQKFCYRRNIFYLERNLSVQTTHISPIAAIG